MLSQEILKLIFKKKILAFAEKKALLGIKNYQGKKSNFRKHIWRSSERSTLL
jgi:hypothetical protein